MRSGIDRSTKPHTDSERLWSDLLGLAGCFAFFGLATFFVEALGVRFFLLGLTVESSSSMTSASLAQAVLWKDARRAIGDAVA